MADEQQKMKKFKVWGTIEIPPIPVNREVFAKDKHDALDSAFEQTLQSLGIQNLPLHISKDNATVEEIS